MYVSNKCREEDKSIYVIYGVIWLKEISCLEEILIVLESRFKRSFVYGYSKNRSFIDCVFNFFRCRALEKY